VGKSWLGGVSIGRDRVGAMWLAPSWAGVGWRTVTRQDCGQGSSVDRPRLCTGRDYAQAETVDKGRLGQTRLWTTPTVDEREAWSAAIRACIGCGQNLWIEPLS
jgi:hypothetical protein